MDWMELYPNDKQPTPAQIVEFIADGSDRWNDLTDYMDKAYDAKPIYSFSGCSGKPGWNVKYKKGSVAFGTLYPEPGAFSVLFVLSYKLDNEMELMLPTLSAEIAELYRNAGDFMKLGKWMMFVIDSDEKLNDYKKIMALKRKPKDI